MISQGSFFLAAASAKNDQQHVNNFLGFFLRFLLHCFPKAW